MPYRPGETRTCRKCGATNNAALPFCARCGKPLGGEAKINPAGATAVEPGADPPWWFKMAFDLGLWAIVFGLVIGASVFCVGLRAQLNGEFTSESFLTVGFGAAMVWFTQRWVRRTVEVYRASPKADLYQPPPEIDFGEEGSEQWRIPGYGTDADERAERAGEANRPDDGERRIR
jgi:hypothetical protein